MKKGRGQGLAGCPLVLLLVMVVTGLAGRRTGDHEARRLSERTPRTLLSVLIFCTLALTLPGPQWAAPLPSDIHTPYPDSTGGPGVTAWGLRTNLADYPGGRVPRYGLFELAFDLTGTVAETPYFPYDPAPPPGVEPGTGITVDVLLLPPGESSWELALRLPCFHYQPVEEVGEGASVSLVPVGDADWRRRFTPDVIGPWRYKVIATDAAGTSESPEGTFECAPSTYKGFVGVSERDPRFFEFANGTPFVTPLINIEQGNPFNTLAGIRTNVRQMGENGIRFVRWFPTGEGANFFVAPYADTIRINWRFGDGWVTAEGADAAAGKRFAYRPYFYSGQTLSVLPDSRYRLRFRAEVTGERVLRAQIGNLPGGTIDICSITGTVHEQGGGSCAHREADWRDYELIVETGGSVVTSLDVALRGLYVSADAPAPYNTEQPGSIRVHSIRFQRDETGDGDWGGNLLTRGDPDTYGHIDQQAAARLDEVLRQSEIYGVYHKLTLFHKNDALLARFLPDGTVGDWDVNNFYAAEGHAARWYAEAYARFFVARWSYSPAIHSLELANENHLDARSQDAAFAVAQVVRDLSPRYILQSNSFWGWWVESFWTDPERGHLMDYSDKHWYADESGSHCDENGENCDLISNVWDDSAAYVRECALRFDEYRRAFDYHKPIVRGEGGVAISGTGPQHPDIALDPAGTYYHKKLWAHLGILGDTCDGEWYPRLFVGGGEFPNVEVDLYRMFAAYERFLAGERLSSGTFVEIGTDLTGSRRIPLDTTAGELRAWGVQDTVSGRTLLWIDNAAHTWKAVVDGAAITPASGTLTLAGFEPGKDYAVQWWDPYATPPSAPDVSLLTARLDGTLVLTVDGLGRDVALKVAVHTVPMSYLPLAVKAAGGPSPVSR